MKKIRINRKMWRRGGNIHDQAKGRTKLYDKDHNVGCCLGHLVHKISKCAWDELNGKEYPKQFYKKPNVMCEENAFLGLRNSEFVKKAVNTNDEPSLNESERETKLIALFATKGFELEFYGDKTL